VAGHGRAHDAQADESEFHVDGFPVSQALRQAAQGVSEG
jgi:hypothetical protein